MSNEINEANEAEFYGEIAPGWEFYRRKGARFLEDEVDWVVDLKSVDRGQHEGFHRFDKAHLVMLTEQDLVPCDAAVEMLTALREMEDQGYVSVREEGGHQGHAGEAYLIDTLGEDVGGYIHLGRSSNDLRPVSLRIMMREYLLDTMDAILDLMAAYCDAAEEYKDAIMPTYTVYQHAQVGTFGWHLMAWERGIERSFDRLVETYARVNQSPAGSAAETTTDFPIDRERVADLLGFDVVMDNGKDATRTDVDTYLEVANDLTLLLASVSIAARRVLLWNMTEIDRIHMPDRYLGTSSIMPQKRNPGAAMAAHGGVDSLIGTEMQLLASVKGDASTPAVPESAFEKTIDTLDHWAELVSALEFDRELAEEQVYLDWTFATDIAGALVREEGLPWRMAHQIVAILVRRAEERDTDVRDITMKDIDEASVEYMGRAVGLNEDALDEIIDPQRALDARSAIPGSPAPEQVQNQIDRSREAVTEGRDTVEELRDRLTESDRALEDAIDAIVGA